MKTAATDRTVLYRSDDGERIEHARLRSSAAGAVGDGTIIGLCRERPLRARYELTSDSRWHARNVSVEALSANRGLLSLAADDDGIWRRVDGGSLSVPIFHCFDVAVALTPVPMALTIRRLALALRAAAIVDVASIDVPALTVRMIEHRYTCLEIEADGSLYRFENFDTGERAQIRVDADGVVAAHEGLFTRVWPTHKHQIQGSSAPA